MAVSARAEPRFTRDVDLAVSLKSDREAEALILAVQARCYRIDTVLEQETTGRLATVARDDERRPQDAIDIRALLQEATASDLKATKRL